MISKEQYNLSLGIIKQYNKENPKNQILIELDKTTFNTESSKLFEKGYFYADKIIIFNDKYSALFKRTDFIEL
jgi:hypothetical protein